MRTIDRIFGWLMVVSALLHCIGTLSAHLSAGETLWSLGAGLAEALLAALNLLRAGRAADRTLAAVSLAGCVGWLALTVGFANLIHNFADFRVFDPGGRHAGAALLQCASCVCIGRGSVYRRISDAWLHDD